MSTQRLWTELCYKWRGIWICSNYFAKAFKSWKLFLPKYHYSEWNYGEIKWNEQKKKLGKMLLIKWTITKTTHCNLLTPIDSKPITCTWLSLVSFSFPFCIRQENSSWFTLFPIEAWWKNAAQWLSERAVSDDKEKAVTEVESTWRTVSNLETCQSLSG